MQSFHGQWFHIWRCDSVSAGALINKPPVLQSIALSNNVYFQFYLFPIVFYIFFLIIVILKV
jgi:hypothetical protein